MPETLVFSPTKLFSVQAPMIKSPASTTSGVNPDHQQGFQTMGPQPQVIPDGWCLTPLQMGDTLANLAVDFLPDVDAVTGAQAIAAANGVPWDTPAINEWVMDNGGKWLNHVEGTPVVEGSATGGWAVFTDKSEILLPCVDPGERPAGPEDCTCKQKKSAWSLWQLFAAAATGFGLAYALKEDKKKRR